MALPFIRYTARSLGWSDVRLAISFSPRRAGLTSRVECTQLHGCCFQFAIPPATQIDSLFNAWGRRRTHPHNRDGRGWAFLKSSGDIESSPRSNHGMGASRRPPGRPGLFWFCKQNSMASELVLHSGEKKSWHKHRALKSPSANTPAALVRSSLVSHAPPIYAAKHVYAALCSSKPPRGPVAPTFRPCFQFRSFKSASGSGGLPPPFSLESHSPPLRLRSH